MKSLYSHLLLTLLLCACNSTAPTSSFDKTQVIEEVTDMFDRYHKAILAEGLTGEFPYLDNTEQFFWVPPNYATPLSYDSVKTILIQNSKMFNKVEFHFESIEIIPLSAEIANYTGIVAGNMTDTSGTTMPVRIIESGTVIKRNDGWKLLSGQSATLEVN